MSVDYSSLTTKEVLALSAAWLRKEVDLSKSELESLADELLNLAEDTNN